MVTSFGKTLRKLRIDHSERLLDMAEKLDISVAFLSSVEIGKKSVPVGMEDKIIKLYALDQETASILRKEADSCRKRFTIKPSDSFSREIIGMLVRNLENFSQQDLAKLKKLLERVGKKESAF
ncbi:helix-turn-helix domain-containing protein [Bartonella krasnovii]|uniref:Helix-turn-helix domain-containing protein n=1 Tax=Bartonella krasnovii TaxID=2267275 RepID=A0A5B9D1P0_9HYPH|nr:helix-turn-helix domain-containing protein [Bartonella krasnovii]QEE12165.1 helix-turn-helix domain-containing protein [Bartonella krasnovii]UNF37726.1 helix-turn-helix domain-containing protein [Bartonella krasnovii]UNF39543.1 helix-turn-helix domain-containing protein [Bartonella krasnovii]UNF41153.1 helix-turn-helix domain-containing protein [Bartonella krasnovii]UNF42976.1 helix-turn-helix domain-containing protein [Bartonella krasnovii]